ncbi:MAG: hypothetical protein K2X53_02175, partial [Alphaproteobacteria bacterium]|nr:hypothetical protein [Alphaproteobacteria bacterium]
MFQIKDQWLKKSNYVAQKYGYAELKKVYTNYSREQLDILLSETWTREQLFNAETGFQEKPYKGTYLNVNEEGYRHIKTQAPLPLDTQAVNIFCFGGSTLFGYGVADDETIPSYLQEFLHTAHPTKKIHVYNFGNAFYFSSQEKNRFQQLLSKGYIPDIALFMDGLNEFYFGDTLMAITEQQRTNTPEQKIIYFFQHMPVMRLVRSIIYRTTGKIDDHYQFKEDCSPTVLTNKINRYFANKKSIALLAAKYNIKTLHIWQPISVYHYTGKEFSSFRKNDFPSCGYQLFMDQYNQPAHHLLM